MNLETILPYLRDFGGILIILMTIVQIAPIKINPWSWLASTIGNALNRDLSKKIDQVAAKQAEVEYKLDLHIAENEKENALMNRREILTFARQILSGQKHTKESFCEILNIIDDYQRYCDRHPQFANNRCLFAIDMIKDNYKERLAKADFLAEAQRAKKYKEKGVNLE